MSIVERREEWRKGTEEKAPEKLVGRLRECVSGRSVPCGVRKTLTACGALGLGHKLLP